MEVNDLRIARLEGGLRDGRQALAGEMRRLEATISELETQIRGRDAQMESLNVELQKRQEELSRIKGSKAYKLGRALATPVRRIRALLKNGRKGKGSYEMA